MANLDLLRMGANSRRAFFVASTTSLLALASFFCWLAIDATYRQTIDMVPYQLGLKSGTQLGLGDGKLFQRTLAHERRSYRQGPRLLLFAVVTGFAFLSSALAVGQCLFRPTRRRVLVIGVLVLGWSAFLSFHTYLDQQFFRLRSASLVPQCKLATKTLVENWPTENGTLSGAGEFRVGQRKMHNYLFLELKSPYLMRESLGYSIERSDAGTIHFGLLSRADWQIEYHPQQTQPNSYESSWGHTFRPVRSYRLEDGWYLVQYEAIPKTS